MNLKRSYFRFWGKARADSSDLAAEFHLLVYHNLDVAAVGCVLLEKHPFLLGRLASAMQLSAKDAKCWFIFLLGLHDLGKFAESFQQLRDDLWQYFWPDEKIRKTNYNIRHDSLGMLLWQQTLRKQLFPSPSEHLDDFLLDALPPWLEAIFGHHGWPADKSDRVKNHFRDIDQQAAFEFCQDWMAQTKPDLSFASDHPTTPETIQQQKEASWILAGVAVLADWLGSNEAFFSLNDRPMDLNDYWRKHALPSAEAALAHSGILPVPPKSGLSLQSLFPYINTPTPLQATCENLPIHAQQQLFILEDVTGAGKTEAALILAYRLIESGLAQGVYIGLPTMATANAMYERMVETYRRLFVDSDNPSLILSHGARHLSEKFQQSLLPEQSPLANYGAEEDITAQCNRWLADNRKKALLADVGIGTIDQALLAVMPARHQSLRLLGLLNKVLILDEVHAYDAYTSEPLKRLIQFHAALGGSVILLSATLTRHQRQELADAFYGERRFQPTQQHYPLLTHVQADHASKEIPLATRKSVKRAVTVTFHHSVPNVLAAIEAALKKGQCVCWIRNTVHDAREAWDTLNQQGWLSADQLHLFHSRFAMSDRIDIEQRMLGLFGKASTNDQRSAQVLIATQVVEQSLDLDFDVMISDLAPIDLLIQRAGRLHRHPRGDRGNPILHLFSPTFDQDPTADWYKDLFPKANHVYPHTLQLWRTAKLLQDTQGWTMPNDARNMLETVYADDADCPAGLQDSMLSVLGDKLGQKDAGSFASLKFEAGYAGNDRWDEDARIATRLGEESHVVYLARWENGRLTPWANAGPYPWDLSSLRVNWKQLTRLAPYGDSQLDLALEELKERESLFDDDSFVLPLEFRDQCWNGSVKDENGYIAFIKYDRNFGFVIERQQ